MGEQQTATIETIKTSIETALTGIQTDMFEVMAVIIPVGLAIFAAVWLVRNGKAVFSMTSKPRA